MSTYWGYVCQSHDPELLSDRWLNHGDDVLTHLYTLVRAGKWPKAADLLPQWALAYGDDPAPMLVDGVHALAVPPAQGGGAPPWSGPPAWLMEHPHCKIALRSEYGEYRELP